MVSVEFSERAAEHFQDLEKETQRRIGRKLEEVKQNTESGLADPERYLESLTGYAYYRMRVGDYRLFIDWRQEQDTFFIISVQHRRNSYKGNLPE